MAYGRCKDFTKRTESDKVLKDKTFKIASNSKYDDYERGLASMFYKYFDKNLQVVVSNLCQINNLQMNFINKLLENLKDAKSVLLLRTIFGGADLADMQLISKCNKGIRFLLCVIYILANMHGVFL